MPKKLLKPMKHEHFYFWALAGRLKKLIKPVGNQYFCVLGRLGFFWFVVGRGQGGTPSCGPMGYPGTPSHGPMGYPRSLHFPCFSIPTWSHLVAAWFDLVPTQSHLARTGSHLVPAWSHLVHTGFHLVPAWSNLVPTASHLVPTGSHLVPTWSHLVPAWSYLVLTWSDLLRTWSQFGPHLGVLVVSWAPKKLLKLFKATFFDFGTHLGLGPS